jgi:hypothetical protein
VEALLLKLVLTPILVGAASLAGRRWGAEVGGWLVGIPFPLYATVLAVFAHRLQGGDAAVGVLRGLVLGLFAFAGFFAAVGLLLVPDGMLIAFSVALIVALAVQAISLAASRILKIV